MTYPSICVVIPAHNSEFTLGRALDSVARQSLRPSEIIVVDDASTDRTVEVARSYARLPVRVIQLERNLGAAGARNHGIRATDASLIAFLDADDEWLVPKLELQVALIAADKKMSFVSCGSNLIAPSGQDLGDIYRGHAVVSGGEAWKALLEDNFVTTPSVLVWRSHLATLGGFNEALKIAEDQDMWIRLAELGDLGYVRRCLVLVHERERSLSAGSFSDQLDYTLPMVEGHLRRLVNRLTPREIATIRGRRLLRLGQLAYSRGEPVVGRELIVRSMRMGYRPWEGASYLVKANPIAIWLKRKFIRQ